MCTEEEVRDPTGISLRLYQKAFPAGPSEAAAERVGFVPGGGAADGTGFKDAGGADRADGFGVFAADPEAVQRGEGAVETGGVFVGHGQDVAEALAGQPGVDHGGAVNEGFELGADGVEVDGGAQDDGVGGEHFPENLRGAVADRAASGAAGTGLAAGAGGDGGVGQAAEEDGVAGVAGAVGHAAAEEVGIAVTAGGGGDDQDGLGHGGNLRKGGTQGAAQPRASRQKASMASKGMTSVRS